MKPRCDEETNGRGCDSHPVQSLKERRKDQRIGDEPRLIRDGNGNGFDSPEIFEVSVTERILKTLEDFLPGVLCCGYGIGSEDISLPAPRKVEGEFSFSVRKFKMGRHNLHLYPLSGVRRGLNQQPRFRVLKPEPEIVFCRA
jgi:hypothetical protein